MFSRPWAFIRRVFHAFRHNQGMLLSGAVAYYTLLSIVPLIVVLLAVLSHFVLLTLEAGSMILLFGAQVIAELERSVAPPASPLPDPDDLNLLDSPTPPPPSEGAT